jgi:hypothetical protein
MSVYTREIAPNDNFFRVKLVETTSRASVLSKTQEYAGFAMKRCSFTLSFGLPNL